jgi:hypothetical protein
MSLRRLLRSWTRPLARTGYPHASRPSRRTRPRLEGLEDRTLFAAQLVLSGSQTLVVNANVAVNTSSSQTESEMQVDINPTNPLNLAGFTHNLQNFNEMQLFFSTNGGTTWNRRVVNGDGFGTGFRFDPSVAFDANGNLFVAYGVDPNAGGPRRLIVARSGDGGNSFSNFFVVQAEAGVDNWHIATGRSGPGNSPQAVYITYTRNLRDGQHIAVSGLRFGVDSAFTAPVNINSSANPNAVLNSGPAVGPNGELYVTWNNYTQGKIYVDRKLNGLFGSGGFAGNVLVRQLQFTGNRVTTPAAPHRGFGAYPSIAVDRSGGPFNGRVYIAFTDRFAAPNDYDVFLTTSTNQGASWSALGTVGNVEGASSTDFNATATVDQNTGAVGVLYYTTDAAPDNSQINARLAVSTNGGSTFVKSDVTTQRSREGSASDTNEFLDYIGLAARNGTLQAFWADNRGSTQGTFSGNIHAFTASVATHSTANQLVVTDNGTVTLRSDPANPAYLDVIANGVLEWAGLWASVGSVVINGSGTINIQDTVAGVPVAVNSSTATTVNIGNNNSVAGIQGPVSLENEPSFDTVNINDQSDATAHTAVLDTVTRSGDSSLGRLTGIGAAPITWDYFDTTAVNINFGAGTSTVNVLGTGVTTNLFNLDLATINIGNGSMAGIQGPLNLENEPSFDTVNINDQSDITTHTAILDTVTRSGDTSLGRLTGIGAAPITWDYFDTTAVNIIFGPATSTVNVLGTGVVTTLFNLAPATVNIGNSNSIAGIQGPLNLENEPSFDTVNINDQSDITAHTAILDTVTRSGDTSLGRLQGIAAAITWDYNDTTTVNINLGSGDATVNVLGTGVPTAINNFGAATVTVGNLGSLADIQGAVTLFNGPSRDQLTIDDSADAADQNNVVISDTGVTGLAPAPLNFTSFSINMLSIQGGSGNNNYTVTGTPALALALQTGPGVDAVNVQAEAFFRLTIDSSAGGGADVITLGNAANSLADITGPVTLTGAGDALVLEDQGNSAAQTYTLTDSTVTWAGGPVVTYGGLGALMLNNSNGGDHVNVESTNAGDFTTVNAGTGGDIFRITPTSQSLANIVGPLTLNDSGSGGDALEFFDQNNPASETYTFDATPSNLTLATVSVSINFSWVGSVYLETNGASTVNDASGTVLVDVPPLAPPSPGGGTGQGHVVPAPALKGDVAVPAAPPVAAEPPSAVAKGDAAPADASPVTDAVLADLFARAAEKSSRGV